MRIRNDRRGKTAVAGIAGKKWPIAKVFSTLLAITTEAARVPQPWDSDPLPQDKPLNTGPQSIDTPDYFVTGNNGNMRTWQFTVHDMQIRAAYATCANNHPDLSRTWQVIREFGPFERRSNALKYHRPHSNLQLQPPNIDKTGAGPSRAMADNRLMICEVPRAATSLDNTMKRQPVTRQPDFRSHTHCDTAGSTRNKSR